MLGEGRMLLSNFILRLLLALFLTNAQVFADVLELGESQLHGKKDQPEAMTFVARAPLDDNPEVVIEKKMSNKIKQEIKSPIFDVSLVAF